MVIMVLLSIFLNSYWMWLMIKMIWRVIQRTLAEKNSNHEPIEKVELVKADALAIDNNEAEDGSSTQGSNAGEVADEACNDPEI